MHELTPVNIGWRRWKCQACDESFTHWNRGVQTLCSASNAAGGSKLPSIAKRLQLANQWWAQTLESIAKERAESQDLLNHFSFLNNQKRLSMVNSLSSPPKLFGGIPLMPSEADGGHTKFWWSCSLCDFKISLAEPSSGRSYKRKNHLQKVHAWRKVPPIPRQGFAVQAVQTSQSVVKQRWEHRVAEFQKRAWAGAHDIGSKAVCVTLYTCKSGKVLQYPRYQCKRCCRMVTAGDLPISICSSHPRCSKAPSLKRRKQIWQTCLKVAARLSKVADGVRATRRGHRAQRIGEASHPGPCPVVKMWSQNIRSWHTNGMACLDRAQTAGISLVALQEMNITSTNAPAVVNACLRHGWQMLQVPSPQGTSNRGGVAICCREPLGLVLLDTRSDPQGQFVLAEVHGGNKSFKLCSYYRHADDEDFQGLTRISQTLSSDMDQAWIVAMDANTNQMAGTCATLMNEIKGCCRAHAGHNSSRFPIDGIWSSLDLRPTAAFSWQPGDGDHSLAEVHWEVQTQKPGRQQFRFAHTRKMAEQNFPSQQEAWALSCTSDERWTEVLSNVDQAWLVWCQDIETWLTRNGILDQGRPERPLGSAPRVQTSTHAMGPLQPLAERKLRRWIRRLQEARKFSHLGYQLNPGLQKKLESTRDVPAPEKQAVRQAAFGLAERLAHGRLQALLQNKSSQKLNKWKTLVTDHSGACKWVKLTEVGSPVLQDESGQILTSRPRALAALHTFWSRTFGDSALDSWDQFSEVFQEHFPMPAQTEALPPITGKDIIRVARKMKDKAGGPDGITPRHLTCLPQLAIDRFAQILQTCENIGRWPTQVRHWKICFLPKATTRKGVVAGLGDVRPISVGPTAYRIWAAIRLQHCKSFVEGLLCQDQAGCNGLAAQDLLLTMENKYQAQDWPYAMALDLQKAFDTTDWTVCLKLLKHAGLQAPILKLLQDQWDHHERWLSYRGAIDPAPLKNTAGLPQGDPWSPIAMSALMAVASRFVLSQEPNARSLIYLDDRTLVATSRQALNQALQAWEVLFQNTRLRNNASKQQFLPRTLDARVECLQLGIPFQNTAKILGVCMGLIPRSRTEEEQKRSDKVAQVARRIALLPTAKAFRNSVAVSVLAPTASWGALFNGRCPTKQECQAYAQTWRCAVQGFDHPGGHDSRDLTAVMAMGHCSDLLFLSTQRFMTALHKWALRPNQIAINSAPIKALQAAVQRLQGSWTPEVGFSFFNGRWLTSMPVGFISRCQHLFRQHWRTTRFTAWVQSERIDSQLARAQGIHATEELIDKLRSFARSASGDQVAVLCGGITTDAHIEGLREFCPDCHCVVCPSTEHVLWQCETWKDHRVFDQPTDPMCARMGWNQNGVHPCLGQMATIRAVAAEARMKRLRLGRAPCVGGTVL